MIANPKPRAASYADVKAHVRDRIVRGDWAPGRMIPSEAQLTAQFGLSRMTVNRALRELAAEGMLVRTQGLGTFVAELSPVSSLVRIRDIREEIVERGHRHALRVLAAPRRTRDAAIAARLGLPLRSALFVVRVVHAENDVPVQLEERWVNPAAAPHFLSMDIARETPSSYLLRVAPLTEAEHVVEALPAGPDAGAALGIAAHAPCLVVTRRTWSGRVVAAYARLVHPGGLYRLAGSFRP